MHVQNQIKKIPKVVSKQFPLDSNQFDNQTVQDYDWSSLRRGYEWLGDYICMSWYSNRFSHDANQFFFCKSASLVIFGLCTGFPFSLAPLPSFICTSLL